MGYTPDHDTCILKDVEKMLPVAPFLRWAFKGEPWEVWLVEPLSAYNVTECVLLPCAYALASSSI